MIRDLIWTRTPVDVDPRVLMATVTKLSWHLGICRWHDGGWIDDMIRIHHGRSLELFKRTQFYLGVTAPAIASWSSCDRVGSPCCNGISSHLSGRNSYIEDATRLPQLATDSSQMDPGSENLSALREKLGPFQSTNQDLIQELSMTSKRLQRLAISLGFNDSYEAQTTIDSGDPNLTYRSCFDQLQQSTQTIRAQEKELKMLRNALELVQAQNSDLKEKLKPQTQVLTTPYSYSKLKANINFFFALQLNRISSGCWCDWLSVHLLIRPFFRYFHEPFLQIFLSCLQDEKSINHQFGSLQSDWSFTSTGSATGSSWRGRLFANKYRRSSYGGLRFVYGYLWERSGRLIQKCGSCYPITRSFQLEVCQFFELSQ